MIQPDKLSNNQEKKLMKQSYATIPSSSLLQDHQTTCDGWVDPKYFLYLMLYEILFENIGK
jgi:hypothetical protein